MKIISLMLNVVVATAAVAVPATAPFRLPVGAQLTTPSTGTDGWQGEGRVSAPFVQTRGRLLAAVTASGWRFIHEIPLGDRNGRVLMAFSREGRELTLMIWRESVDRSGFSFGVTNGRKS